VVKVENEAPARWRKPPANGYSLHPRQARLSSTLLWAVAAVASRYGLEKQGFRGERDAERRVAAGQRTYQSFWPSAAAAGVSGRLNGSPLGTLRSS